MAKTVNEVRLLGNLGRAPEVKRTQGGATVATFSLATANRYKDRSGEWKEEAEWHNCVAWNGVAEILEKYVGKGSKLYVEGRLKTRSWDDRETGKKRYATEIIVSDVTLLDGGERRQGGARSDADEEHRGYAYTREEAPDQGITDDDIPF